MSCHGPQKQKGGLRMDSAEWLAKGGKNGPVLVPGKPAESKLLIAIAYKDEDLQMPPDEKLPADKVAILAQWVEMGAPFPLATQPITVSRHKKRTIRDEDRQFWAFQPVANPAPPAVKDAAWAKNDVDRFILAKLEAEGLTPAPEADKRTLVRRAYFDLWGLPPSPEDVDAFVNDKSADAWDKLIDKLMSSPRYGERWGRHWLDLARYAESDGYRQDAYRPNAWPYRDYVIRSFNDDKPYDRFVMEQLAGDQLEPGNPDVLIGTAFLRHTMYEYNQTDVRAHWQTHLDDVADVTSDVFLGLSMGCAKCHDHKFDPILQTDYYKLQAFFTPMIQQHEMPLMTPAERAKYDAAMKNWETKTASLRAEIDKIEGPFIKKAGVGALKRFPQDIQDLCNKPAAERTLYEEQLVQLAMRQVYGKQTGDPKVSGADKDKHLALVRKLGEFDDIKPKPPLMAFVATDIGPKSPPTHVEGNPKKEEVQPGYPVVLDGKGLAVPEIKPTDDSTGRRLALAKWLTPPPPPPPPRVMANRVWHYHFGRGLVGTTSDYGKLGDRPTHPELLDWLTTKFVGGGWRIKPLHKLIMTSATYRQSSARPAPEQAKLKDPDNKWLWRFPSHRLDAEQIRDAMLAVSGELKLDAMFGPAVDPVQGKRSIYTKAQRNVRDPLLDAFDLPESFGSVGERNRTTTATQSLLLINGDATLKRAEMMAGRLAGMKLKDAAETVKTAFELAYGRPPTDPELQASVDFLGKRSAIESVATGETAKPVAPSMANPEDVLTTDDKPVVKTMPHMGTQAVYVRDARPDDMLKLASPGQMPTEDFTIEAYVLLDSLYENANVRVIAAHWDGKNGNPGWSLGVTSTKSRFEPQNLILQLSGDAKGGNEVIPSDFKLDLHKTYYVAVSVRLKDTSDKGITFYVKDVSDMDAVLKSVSVAHKFTGPINGGKAPLMVGGRGDGTAHGWDGLIDEVRISKAALTKAELLFNDGKPKPGAVVGHWQFEDTPGIFKDLVGVQKDMAKNKLAGGAAAYVAATRKPAKGGDDKHPAATPTAKADRALVDFCHVLLNSNGFLYVD